MQLLSGNDNNVKMSDLKLGKKDVLIERLQEALKNPNMTSDDVCNLLSNDLYEREKLAQLMNEFNKEELERNIKLLDSLLSHLRYFKRLSEKQRYQFYEHS